MFYLEIEDLSTKNMWIISIIVCLYFCKILYAWGLKKIFPKMTIGDYIKFLEVGKKKIK